MNTTALSAPAAATAAPLAPTKPATTEPTWVRVALIAVALIFLTLFLFVPLIAVFVEAFKKGWNVYLAAIVEPDALSAIKLTLITAAIAVLKMRRRPRSSVTFTRVA